MGNTDIFETIASTYDTPVRIHIAKITSDAIRKYIGNAKDRSAIDFGCGTGLVGLNLVDDFGHITFLDTSANMIGQIDQKLADAGIRIASTVCFDFETGFRSDLRADYVFMAQVLLHIQDIEPVLSRLYDVLNPGGHLLIADFDKNENVRSDKVHNGFDQGELARLMTAIGFKDVRSETIYTGEKIFMNQDASMFIMDSRK
ncbi:class I SAM-dependent methyltransferase [Paenibacillus tarimensis]|uniref:class I SAM-dependent methyltransferase n=1 Tax=Paenibacillus tarimensis TaxID=416012 RepID=UPI001F35519A|nr:class I SAM-dependent methyltransferase [Paenibacillus tarimensis]MCF2945469.1 class I SAM-dependent methyltransferase [Paenibacillus tarimensis]